MRFATKAIRVAQTPEGPHYPVVAPIYQTATYAWPDLDSPPEYQYTRYGAPNADMLARVVAALENAKHGLACSSGMAALSAATSLLKPGDHVVLAGDIYGGTYALAHNVLKEQGIEIGEFDAMRPPSLQGAIHERTKMLIFETPTNPNLRVVDIAAVLAQARLKNLIVVFDNTFATPALQQPLDMGADIVVHATTKYIGGHSDVIGGVVVTNDDVFAQAMVRYNMTTGGTPSPFDCWLALRGVKTLAVRMKAHCANALAVAEFLESHPYVARVHYPGLPSHPDHALAARQMSGFGGMVAVEVAGSGAQARRVAEACRVFLCAPSLGGVESLVSYPPEMSHSALSEEERIAKGIPSNLLRLSVGIEDSSDLTEDLDQALRSVLAE